LGHVAKGAGAGYDVLCMKRALALLSIPFAACFPPSSTPTTPESTATTPSTLVDAGQPAPKPAWKRSCTEYAHAPVDVTYEEAVGGAAVVYQTGGDVAALRQRTHEVAEFHNSSRSKVRALHDLFAIPHRAQAEDIEHGARLTLVPKSVRPRDLESLRINVQQEVFTLRRRGCGTGQEAL
jgi:hypothetical protein